jgi:hypothetical protein
MTPGFLRRPVVTGPGRIASGDLAASCFAHSLDAFHLGQIIFSRGSLTHVLDAAARRARDDTAADDVAFGQGLPPLPLPRQGIGGNPIPWPPAPTPAAEVGAAAELAEVLQLRQASFGDFLASGPLALCEGIPRGGGGGGGGGAAAAAVAPIPTRVVATTFTEKQGLNAPPPFARTLPAPLAQRMAAVAGIAPYAAGSNDALRAAVAAGGDILGAPVPVGPGLQPAACAAAAGLLAGSLAIASCGGNHLVAAAQAAAVATAARAAAATAAHAAAVAAAAAQAAAAGQAPAAPAQGAMHAADAATTSARTHALVAVRAQSATAPPPPVMFTNLAGNDQTPTKFIWLTRPTAAATALPELLPGLQIEPGAPFAATGTLGFATRVVLAARG